MKKIIRRAINSSLALLALSHPPALALAPLPAGWPEKVEVGVADGAGGAAAVRAVAPYGFRYQYLAGGANTGAGWATWNPGGAFVTNYAQDSADNNIIPVFTYYMIRQSQPNAGVSNEANAVNGNLNNLVTMNSYFSDLKLFFQRAGAFPHQKIVLHVEPDMWGYIQQRAAGDNAATVSAQVGAAHVETAGLPNNAAGLAQAIARLRDKYAPNVWLGYHVSVWGTGVDIAISDPSDATVDSLGLRAANFYKSLGAEFDVIFAEFSDRDSGFKIAQYGAGQEAWWDADDFRRMARFLSQLSDSTQKRVVMWQIPLGNTKMRAMDNTWGHYQDNRPEWFFDDPGRGHLAEYVNAGVVAFLFGGGAAGTTCACDGTGDGATNPAPINGNTAASLNAEDDGGFFHQKTAAYYAAGAVSLNENAGGNPSDGPRVSQRFLSPWTADGRNDTVNFPNAQAVSILNVDGRQVYEGARTNGALSWNGRDNNGRLTPSGVYVAKITRTDGDTVYESLLVIK